MNTATAPVAPPPPLRTQAYVAPRRRWPGLLAAAIVGGAVVGAFVSSHYDERSVGERIDAGVAVAESAVKASVGEARSAADAAAQDAARVAARIGEALGDGNITTAVKAALAADPALSALKIDVTTVDGVVRLDGPAPDERARERASVLAAAPTGVAGVDNRLVVTGR